jgi:hypothetical protein
LKDLALPAPTRLLRNTDPEDTGVWQIPTAEGPVIGRFYADGRRVFFLLPRSALLADSAWRPWNDDDRPEVERVWESFAAWWADQGYAWPPGDAD